METRKMRLEANVGTKGMGQRRDGSFIQIQQYDS